MTTRVLVLLLPLLLTPSLSFTQEKKPDVLKVSLESVAKDPAKYHEKLIQIEGILVSFENDSDDSRWFGIFKEEKQRPIYLSGTGNPDLFRNDKVIVTGKFVYLEKTFCPLNIEADGNLGGKFEKAIDKK
jgi:hypothetical protein